MITLRPYQAEGISKIRHAFASRAKAPLYVLPTGGGKTVLFSAIAESSQKRGKRVLILAHRVELVDQIVTALKQFDVNPDVIAAGYRRGGLGGVVGHASSRAVAVASVQTLVRRLEQYPPPMLIIIDECHHVTKGGTWHAIINHYPNAKLLGVTATPIRTDSRGLAAHFDQLIVGPSVAELTAHGYLAPARVFAPPTVDTSGLHIRMGEYQTAETEALMDAPSITGDALQHYKKHANGLPALVFCTSVKHAHHVAERFRAEHISAVALDGGTDRDVRRMAVADYRDGKIKVMASCDLFSEGFDVRGVHVGIMLRPTASEGLWRQQIGRTLRPAPGKKTAIIFDHVGGTFKFGLPAEPREWELTADIIKRKKSDSPSIRVCPKCFAASPARAATCVECGHVFEVKPRQDIKEKDGELVELTPDQIARKRARREQGRARSLEQLLEFAKMKGYHENWAYRLHAAREAKREKEGA